MTIKFVQLQTDLMTKWKDYFLQGKRSRKSNKGFTGSTGSDFFQGQMNRVLFYWPNNSKETRLNKQEVGDF